MHQMAPSVRENEEAVAALSPSVPAINSGQSELPPLLPARHAMIGPTPKRHIGELS